MADFVPRPHPGVSVDGLDRELWTQLRVLVAARPGLAWCAEPTTPAEMQAGRRGIARSVRELDLFADEVSTRLLSGVVPAEAGSARAVAASVVGLSRAFTVKWAGVPVPSAARMVEFNQDVELLTTLLDSIAPRIGDPDESFLWPSVSRHGCAGPAQPAGGR